MAYSIYDQTNYTQDKPNGLRNLSEEQGPSASEPQPPSNNVSNGNSAPQTPSNNVSDTTPDPQEFADQKKEEVKQSYSTSKEDRINNAYKDNYGRNADPEEISNWMGTGMGIEDIQSGLKTSYARDGEHLSGDALANLQFNQEPSEPTPTPEPTPEPEPTPPPTTEERLESIDQRFADSDAFYDRLKSANTPITPDNNQQYNNSNSNGNSNSNSSSNSNSGNNVNSNTNNNGATSSFNSSYSNGNYSSNYTMNSGNNNNNNNQFDGMQNLENLKNFNDKRIAEKGFMSQQDQFKGITTAMEDAKRGRMNPMEMAQNSIDFNNANNPIDGKAGYQQIFDMIQNFKDQATLKGVENWGDRDSQQLPKFSTDRFKDDYVAPDFGAIANEQQEKIKDIYK